LIGREALDTSVSPAQNFSNPPPVPEVPTVTLTPGFSPWNVSAAASVSGPTVLEPSVRIEPERLPPPPPPPLPLSPHAARSSAPAAMAATVVMGRIRMPAASPPRPRIRLPGGYLVVNNL
jgi:hypothetical protein